MDASNYPLVALPGEDLAGYLAKIKRFPNLEAEEEYMLAKRYHEHQDLAAAHRLVTSHLKLVPKIAAGYKGYGLPMIDVIAEGNIGLMQAVKRYNPELGYRLSTYAIWWIRASIQEFILRSYSLVKIGTTAAQKKLFFNLRKLRHKIQMVESRSLNDDEISQIAEELNVSEAEVSEMEKRLTGGGDLSLNRPISQEDGEDEVISLIPETRPNQEQLLAVTQEQQRKRDIFSKALEELSEREQQIIVARKLQEEPATLKELSQKLGVSQERIRQIEERALEKLKELVRKYDSL